MPVCINRNGKGCIMYIKLMAIILGVWTIGITVTGSEIERNAIKILHSQNSKIVATTTATTLQQDQIKEADQEGIIRNSFLMFLIGGGSFGGAVVCVILWISTTQVEKRKAIDNKNLPVSERGIQSIASYFTVSLLTAIFLSPLTLKQWRVFGPEECFAGSFLMAVGAWVMWGITHAIGARFLKAAETKGIGGVIDEAKGHGENKS